MKFFTILSLVATLAVARVSSQNLQCKRRGGACVVQRSVLQRSCRKLPYDCGNTTAICCRNTKKYRGERRKCKRSPKCLKESGTCLQWMDVSTCTTVTVDNLCRGKSCTCCLGDNRQCGSSASCTQQGGFCTKKNKRNKYCSLGTVDETLCSGKKCVCCIVKSPGTLAPAPTTDCSCGRANEGVRIVGGEDVSTPNKYPWMVGLKFSDGFNGYSCGATLINNRYALTAAHCLYDPISSKPVKAKEMQVGLADHQQLSTNDDIPGVTRLVKVDSYIVHPEYSIKGYGEDIALVKLKEPVDLTAYKEIKPACLPKDDSNTYEGYNGIVAGWGVQDYNDGSSYPDVLMEVSVPILDTKCNGYNPSFKITKKMMCAGYKKGGKDACSGDSGGPMVVNENGIYTLVGIVSLGEGCAEPNAPGIYTRVSKYLDWIAQNTNDASYCSL
ncbi:phenoloxidase-activating factor 3-like isoform X1 [Macrobrachium nipponense]|uniref:phenoloxidase-activating factor 3-like isoform X1 n=2 Tax=Macrobrachium nipponense TaxID=159736 RepID=UPI0030C8C7C6